MTIELFGTAVVLGSLAGTVSNWGANTLPWMGASETTDRPHRQSRRTLLLVTGMIISFVLTAWLLGPNLVRISVAWLYTAFLLTVLVIDFEHRRVLNIMLGPAAIVVLALSLLPQTPTLQESLLGAAAGLGLFLLVYLISRGKLGMGDVKLAGLIGLMLGYPAVINALVLGIILGAAAAIVLLASKRATRKSTMAYAPYLALGALLIMWLYW